MGDGVQHGAAAGVHGPEVHGRGGLAAQEAGGVGSWEWNIDAGTLHWSESCHRLHGTDPAVPPSYDAWRAGIHPDDLKEVVYTMRYDRASAVYAEFGPFYAGMVTPLDDLLAGI